MKRFLVLLAALAPLAVFTPASAVNLLVGRSTLASQHDSNPAGVAEAFPYAAINSGTANSLQVYVDSGSTASSVQIGLYSNTSGGNPGTLLETCTVTPAGGWNSCGVPGATVTAGVTYWVAVLAKGGSLNYLDEAAGGLDTDHSQPDSKTGLRSLPSTWSPGAPFNTDKASMFAGAA